MMGKREIRSGEVEAFLGKNTSFEGKMTFDGMIRLDGKFNGEVFSEDLLVVGETGDINAEISVGSLVVKGKVSGNIIASCKIEIHPTGELYGNISTPTLVIEEGGVLDGNCKMEMDLEVVGKKVTPLKGKESQGSEMESR